MSKRDKFTLGGRKIPEGGRSLPSANSLGVPQFLVRECVQVQITVSRDVKGFARMPM